MMKKQSLKFRAILLIISINLIMIFPFYVLAVESTNPSGLPDIIASQSVSPSHVVGTEVTSPSGQKFYGGLGGSEAILNYTPGYLHGFERANIDNCRDKVGLPQLLCFTLEYSSADRTIQPTSIKTMSSRTYRDGVANLETSVLLYPENLIVGDVYGFNDPSFAHSYFGKNLRLDPNRSANNSFWNLPGYNFNPRAQAYWSSGNNTIMNSTIDRLMKNTKDLPINPMTGIFDGICGILTTCPERNQSPEGRVWSSVSAVQVGITSFSQLNYGQKSTIIVGDGVTQGDLIIDASILPGDQNASIGFIVRKGNVRIINETAKKRTIKASIFSPGGTIIISGGNIDLIGSFVAGDFSFDSSASNISFIHDTRGESVYPPGFRELQIPSMLAK